MSSVSKTLTKDDFDAYNATFAPVYSKFGQHDSNYSQFGSKLMKNIFLNETTSEARILNVGAGSSDLAGSFVNQFINYCCQIVLCEVNTNFINDYKKSDWYKKYHNKIYISEGGINDAFTNYDNQFNDNSFDIIWCSHVFYHFKMKDIPKLLLKMNDLLKPAHASTLSLSSSSINTSINTCMNTSGLCVITVADDNGFFVENIYKKLKPNYHLSQFIKNKLIQTKLMENCVELKHLENYRAKKKELIELFHLFVENVIYSNDDYGTPDELKNIDERNKIDNCINQMLPQLLHVTPNVESDGKNEFEDEYVWKQDEITYLFRKANTKHSKL